MSVINRIPGYILMLEPAKRRSAFMEFLGSRIPIPTPSGFQFLYTEQFSEEEMAEAKELLTADIDYTGEDRSNEDFDKEITIFKEILSFKDGTFKIGREVFDINDKEHIKKKIVEFENMDDKKMDETNKSKFFIALRTLLAIIIVGTEDKDKKQISFDIQSGGFKEVYNKTGNLFIHFGIKTIGKCNPNYLTVVRHLLKFCKSKLYIPDKLKGKPNILGNKQ